MRFRVMEVTGFWKRVEEASGRRLKSKWVLNKANEDCAHLPISLGVEGRRKENWKETLGSGNGRFYNESD